MTSVTVTGQALVLEP